MRLTILGASAAAQNPGGACSSYLVRRDDTNLVLDMGSGAFANLQRHVAPDTVDAIVLSHMHADHVLDMLPFRYDLLFRGDSATGRPRLLLPPGGHETLLRLSAMQDPAPTFWTDVFAVEEYDPATSLTIGELTIVFHAVHHIPHTYALRVCEPEGGVLAYSADTGPCAGLIEAARDADLFLCENANREGDDYPFHLTPRQAGLAAHEAGARRLVLTHRWLPKGFETAIHSAASVFVGPVLVAREGETYYIAAGY